MDQSVNVIKLESSFYKSHLKEGEDIMVTVTITKQNTS